MVLCRALIRGVDWYDVLGLAAEGRMVLTQEALQQRSSKPSGNGGFAPDVLKATVYYITKNTNFEKALNKSIEFAGSDNYCPILVGSIGGARWRKLSIPKKALTHCDFTSRIENVASLFSEQLN